MLDLFDSSARAAAEHSLTVTAPFLLSLLKLSFDSMDSFGLHSGVFVTRSLIRAISGSSQEQKSKTEREIKSELNSDTKSENPKLKTP